MTSGEFRDSLRTDLSSWEIGPYHGSLPAPMRLKLRLDGEVITTGEVETGFLHRGLEKSLELHHWESAVALTDHLDPEGAAFGELALCLAVEKIANITVPERAQRIRLVLSELSRISTHLGYIARMARSVGAETMLHYVLRDRERILDLFELLTGARFSLSFMRFGGVKADVTEGFIERVLEVCEGLPIRLKEYNDLFTFNHAFLKRTASIGVITLEMVHSMGITGPNARASGASLDVRKKHPYITYDQFDFEVPIGQGEIGKTGDALDRFLIRLREVSQSISILKQVTDAVPVGPFWNKQLGEKSIVIPPGEAYAQIESSRGLLGCHVVSDGGRAPARVQFRPPSVAHLMAVPQLVAGARLEDLAVILASLDLGIAEVDR